MKFEQGTYVRLKFLVAVESAEDLVLGYVELRASNTIYRVMSKLGATNRGKWGLKNIETDSTYLLREFQFEYFAPVSAAELAKFRMQNEI